MIKSTLYNNSQEQARLLVYTYLCRPHLEYSAAVWDLYQQYQVPKSRVKLARADSRAVVLNLFSIFTTRTQSFPLSSLSKIFTFLALSDCSRRHFKMNQVLNCDRNHVYGHFVLMCVLSFIYGKLKYKVKTHEQSNLFYYNNSRKLQSQQFVITWWALCCRCLLLLCNSRTRLCLSFFIIWSLPHSGIPALLADLTLSDCSSSTTNVKS